MYAFSSITSTTNMAKRTLTKKIRAFDITKDVTGKPILKPRATLREPEPRMAFELDCGEAGKKIVYCAPGQMINPHKMCKRMGGTFTPPKPTAEAQAVADAQEIADQK